MPAGVMVVDLLFFGRPLEQIPCMGALKANVNLTNRYSMILSGKLIGSW